MRDKIIILLLSCFPFFSFAQKEYKPVYSIDTPAKFIETDILQNLYIITSNNAILKYDSSGKLLISQQFKNYGEIASIDVTNPLNPEIFFAGQNKIVITDNNLNNVSETGLENSTIQQYAVGCRASAGGYWLYDAQNLKIKRIDQDNITQIETPNLATLRIRDINPAYMTENSPWLYISIPSNGIAVFDQFGAYYKNVPVKNLLRFQVVKNTIVYYTDSTLNYFDIGTNEQKAVNLPFLNAEVQDVKISSHRYWVQTKKGVQTYNY